MPKKVTQITTNRLDRVARVRYSLLMTNNTTRDQIAAAITRRYANMPAIIMPDRPADRSRNGMRTPRSVKHRAIR